jgi:hypothetical protein
MPPDGLTIRLGRFRYRCGVVKIDIEAHDLEALHGIRQTSAGSQPLILSECTCGPELAELCSELKYSVFAFIRDPETLATEFRQIPPQGSGQWTKMHFWRPDLSGPRSISSQFSEPPLLPVAGKTDV